VAQRLASGNSFAVDPARLGLVHGAGRPLPVAVRGQMEAALRADFSAVRVHVGPQAERIGATAFAMGNDLYFAPGRFQPDTPQGRHLLGHELAHVVQQRQGRVRNPLGEAFVVVHDQMLEAEAEQAARRASACQRLAGNQQTSAAAAKGLRPSSTLQRFSVTLDLGETVDPTAQVAAVKVSGRHILSKDKIKKQYGPRGGTTDRHILPWELLVVQAIGAIETDKLNLKDAAQLLTTNFTKPVAVSKRAIEARIKELIVESNSEASNHFLGSEQGNAERNALASTLQSKIKWEQKSKTPSLTNIQKYQEQLAFILVDTPTYEKPFDRSTYFKLHKESLNKIIRITEKDPNGYWATIFHNFDWAKVDPSRTPMHFQSDLEAETTFYKKHKTRNEYGTAPATGPTWHFDTTLKAFEFT
jgi:hypothetical protein